MTMLLCCDWVGWVILLISHTRFVEGPLLVTITLEGLTYMSLHEKNHEGRGCETWDRSLETLMVSMSIIVPIARSMNKNHYVYFCQYLIKGFNSWPRLLHPSGCDKILTFCQSRKLPMPFYNIKVTLSAHYVFIFLMFWFYSSPKLKLLGGTVGFNAYYDYKIL